MSINSYPRGFLLCDSIDDVPSGFVPGPILDNFFVDPLLEIGSEQDCESGKFVMILGACTMLEYSKQSLVSILLGRLIEGEEKFYEAIDWLVGRYTILFGSKGQVKVVCDATAMRPAFYHVDGGFLASHASLIEATQFECEISNLPFSSSFPAHGTPYEDVRVLLPNFVLDLESGNLTRFWPREPLARISTERAANIVLERASAALSRLGEDRDSWLALTAGLDSRVSLAVATHAGIDLKTFTYGKNKDTRVDRSVAKLLSAKLGIKHFEVPTLKPEGELKDSLEKAHYWDHHRSAVGPLGKLIGNQSAAVFSSNILEIGQSNFRKLQWRWGCDEPGGADQMANVYYRKLSKKVRGEVQAFGHQRYMGEVTERFQTLISETGGFCPNILDPFDEYYWMIRMGTWHGPSSLEKDFYGEPLNPFNSRAVITPLISVSKPDQYDTSVFLRLISLVDSSLLDIPINPDQPV